MMGFPEAARWYGLRLCQGTCWYTGNLVIPLAGQGPESFARCPRPVLPCRSWPSAHGKTVSVGASEFPESRTLCRFRRRRRPLNCCCCESRGRQLHWPTGAASQGRVGKEFSERVSDFTEGYTGLLITAIGRLRRRAWEALKFRRIVREATRKRGPSRSPITSSSSQRVLKKG
eukprot:s580_g8.t1